MNDEIAGQFRIIGYVDDLEEAERRIKGRNLSDDLIKRIDVVHDELVDLQPLLGTKEDNDKLKDYLEGLIGELVLAGGEGKVEEIEELIGFVSDKVAKLKEELA